MSRPGIEADPSILGQLLAGQSVFSAFSAREKMGEFVQRAVEGIPGVGYCAVCMPGAERPRVGGEPVPECADCDVLKGDVDHDPCHPCRLSSRVGIHAFPLRTQDRHFGFLLLKVEERERYAPYEPFVGNLANGLAVNIERQWQRDRLAAANVELRRHRGHLEEVVQERTTEVRLSRERERRLNGVLRAIRDVDQLIIRGKERDRLLTKACEILAETLAFRCVWIIGLTPDGRVEAAAEVGVGAVFAGVRAQCERGELPQCCRRALGSEAPIVMDDPVTHCIACPLALQHCRIAGMAAAMRHAGKVYGVLVAALPEEVPDDAGSVSLLGEVAGDLAVALHDSELDRQHGLVAAALRDSEERHRRLFEMSHDALMTLAPPSWRFTSGNPAALAMFGVQDETEFVSRGPWQYSPERQPDGRASAEKSKEMIETAMREGSCFFEWTHKRLSGEEFPATVLLGRIEIHGQSFLQATVRDMTKLKRAEAEREKLEAQLRGAQRMESIGILAGGIAHDFNNLLTGISGFTRFALDQTPEGSSARQDLTEVLTLAARAEALTRQLLAFSRKQALRPRVLNINRTVEDVTRMLGRLIGEDIDIVFVPAPDLCNVNADPGQVEQVLMNLAANARDAMPDGGTLTIETANVRLDEEYARARAGLRPGEYVMLAVSDTGSGMDAKTIEHVFEPFFTTKPKGNGTGLGLATAYGIVKQHGGYIGVYSEPGKGTAFKVYLPRVAAEAVESAVAPAPEAPPRGTETILIVEDEASVRRVAQRALEARGYRVLTAASPSQADEVLAAHGESVALLLTDVVLPERSGRQLYEAAQGRYPRLRVLYMSGYTDSAIVHNGVLDPDTPFLEKPFTLDSLARKVREVLGKEDHA